MTEKLSSEPLTSLATLQTDNFLTVRREDGLNIAIDFFKVKKASLIFRAINNPLRQNILISLMEKEKLSVGEMSVILNVDQSVASLHLGILRRCSILKTLRVGKFIYYELNAGRLEQIGRCSDSLILSL